jgi:hypothetical protein
MHKRIFMVKFSDVRLGFCINVRLILRASETPIFSSEMNGRLGTGRTEPVKRAAGHLRSLPVLSYLQLMRCIPPALDRLMRRYSPRTILP